MDQATFTESVRADLAKELQLGRINEEIERAKAEVDAAPATFTGTQRMLAHNNLHRWMAKKLAVEQDLHL